MARTYVEAGRRRDFVPTLQHRAGDLVAAEGFIGVVQDDAVLASGSDKARPLPLILEGVWDIPANFLDPTVAQPAGRVMFALPTYGATSLKLFPAGSIASGMIAIGRLWATYAASAAVMRISVDTDDVTFQMVNPSVIGFQA